jgi:hypothetical protein
MNPDLRVVVNVDVVGVPFEISFNEKIHTILIKENQNHNKIVFIQA